LSSVINNDTRIRHAFIPSESVSEVNFRLAQCAEVRHERTQLM